MVQLLCPKSLLEFRKLSFDDSRGGGWWLITIVTGKHSSRMRAGYLPTVRASVATRCQYWWREGRSPQLNKFEQVSSDGCQMTLAGGARARGSHV